MTTRVCVCARAGRSESREKCILPDDYKQLPSRCTHSNHISGTSWAQRRAMIGMKQKMRWFASMQNRPDAKRTSSTQIKAICPSKTVWFLHKSRPIDVNTTYRQPIGRFFSIYEEHLSFSLSRQIGFVDRLCPSTLGMDMNSFCPAHFDTRDHFSLSQSYNLRLTLIRRHVIRARRLPMPDVRHRNATW